MAGPAVAIVALALQVIPALLGPSMPAITPQSRAGVVTARDLDLYKVAKRIGNKDVVTQLRVNIALRIPQLKPSAAAILPPVWSAKTPWQLDMAIAQAQAELLR